MTGKNRALENLFEKNTRLFSTSKEKNDVPCIFISYQRKDEEYATEVANFIMANQIDVYFDLDDNDLKKHNQRNNPNEVTNAITKGLNQSNYMIVIVSSNTYLSPWVPFEVGYAFDKKGDKMKILRHKDIDRNNLPHYLKVKELLHGTIPLKRFIASIRKQYNIPDMLFESEQRIKTFSSYTHSLQKYLDEV